MRGCSINRRASAPWTQPFATGARLGLRIGIRLRLFRIGGQGGTVVATTTAIQNEPQASNGSLMKSSSRTPSSSCPAPPPKSLKQLPQNLGVSRSGYHAPKETPPSACRRADETLSQTICPDPCHQPAECHVAHRQVDCETAQEVGPRGRAAGHLGKGRGVSILCSPLIPVIGSRPIARPRGMLSSVEFVSSFPKHHKAPSRGTGQGDKRRKSLPVRVEIRDSAFGCRLAVVGYVRVSLP
jgi:hypothetical protein